MHALRSARFLARLVLAWFVLAVGVAVAAPLVNPQSVELICSGSGGSRLLVKGDDGAPAAQSHNLDCPLCLMGAGAPPPAVQALPSVAPLGRAVQLIPAARIAALVRAPLPARGPPLLSI